MACIVASGTYKLNGGVRLQGSKNAVLPIIAATVLVKGESVIKNCPKISDVENSVQILEALGAKCRFEDNALIINTDNINDYRIPNLLMKKMRSSSIFLGALLGRTGKTRICMPGGCKLGARPIDLHIDALKKMGVDVIEDGMCCHFEAKNGIKGAKLNLLFPSVGATENIILAAVCANGTTEITGCAKEPEIVDLAKFLKKSGAKISGEGTDRVYIEGVSSLYGTEYSVIPDRIVAATYISCAAITGSDIYIEDVNLSHLDSVVSAFKRAGCEFFYKNNILNIKSPKRIKDIGTIKTSSYPDFPTDAGPMLVSALALSSGITESTESIFETRFRYIKELKKMGADIRLYGNTAIIKGVNTLCGAACECTDLRSGAALVTAALMAEGTTVINKAEYIKRGYEDIVRDLKMLGADIRMK